MGARSTLILANPKDGECLPGTLGPSTKYTVRVFHKNRSKWNKPVPTLFECMEKYLTTGQPTIVSAYYPDTNCTMLRSLYTDGIARANRWVAKQETRDE